MDFLDRKEELSRLDRLARKAGGGFAVVYGRRRVGKTRLLLEWCRRQRGIYMVADPSAPPVQRRYLAEALSARIPGFHEVSYPDWPSLLRRLASELKGLRWRGPIVFDELPFLVASSPELPGVLQHWLDHDAKAARLVVAVAGSSQRMMQGMALDASAPHYGRASELLPVKPLRAAYLGKALRLRRERDIVEAYAVWGGIPRYWELAEEFGGRLDEAVDRLVLDPLSPLHQEPDRLLSEEVPSAASLRPILDAVGLGAHRLSEIAGRIGQPATSLSRSMVRLQDLGLIRREVPYGESEKSSKRTLYRIEDPFFGLWFRVVASRRAQLAEAPRQQRLELWREARPAIVSAAWEDLTRQSVPRMTARLSGLGRLGPWMPAGRFWQAGGPDWDVVALSADRKSLLLGEARWPAMRVQRRHYELACSDLLRRGIPPLEGIDRCRIVRAVFLPEAPPGGPEIDGEAPLLVTAKEVIRVLS